MNFNPDPLEKDIEKKVCDFAKTRGILVYKFTSPARRSVPDRLFILPGGSVFWIEFKRKGKKPSPGQEAEIERMRKQGARVHVSDNVEAGKRIIELESL
tara:strand:+ start:1526 stop:1822 length:297 start_codon:yes stop_codon:yes gene_type:complete